MNNKSKLAIEQYQCTGCVRGTDISCYQPSENGISCGAHVAGTRAFPGGLLWLGLPKGFNRSGPLDHNIKLEIYESLNVLNSELSNLDKKVNQIVKSESMMDVKVFYNKFNVPVWKHRTASGHVLVRGVSPRVNIPFLHILLNDSGFDQIPCLEITSADIEKMD
jgi:hypothetical protein